MGDSVAVESWHLPRALSNEALRLLSSLPMEEIERRLRMDGPAVPEEPTDEQLDDLFVEIDGSGETQSWRAFARAVLARWGAADGEVAELTDEVLYLIRELRDQADDLSPSLELFGLLHNAADLLDRAVLARWSSQTTPVPVARLPENAQVIEPANHTILAPIPTPIPVCERLPGPEDCAPHPRTKRGNWCWGFERCKVSLARPAQWRLMHMETVEMEASHWLPAHALPLPEVE